MKRKRTLKIITLVLLLSLFSVFTAFAKEGMLPSASSDTEQAYKYLNADNTLAINQWKYVWDNWYYFGEDGKSKQNTWAEIDGNWYYFDQWSIMQHDATTPDGYYVGSDGAFVEQAKATEQINVISNISESTVKNQEQVWIDNTGKKYHNKSSCSNMSDPYQVTVDEAVNRGYDPCKKCYK